ncbi:MAG TPA: NAD-dependent epimerase/dehydratase family protein [Xanthobacteraceae bacterium]|nr:NAD-dependent epimerase/dehydratase family protein [Xanthobacteraceae bacterium]
MKRVLITGGAGFIGSHVTDVLLASGYRVRILDALSPQVHPNGEPPDYLDRNAELIVGDIRDRVAVERALDGVDAVIHLAAAVGVGQSMYEIASYTEVNDLGTAVLLQALTRRPVDRLVCASSMSVYGEGLASRSDGDILAPQERSIEQLRRGIWDVLDSDGEALTPLPTPEDKQPSLSSIYALNKYNQERQCLIVGKAYGIPTVALRFFNVYGPRQALSNPYTGVLAIFASRLLNDRPPLVFEDGRQRRDFVHVRDVARACQIALECREGIGDVYNIGSGQYRTIGSIARDLARVSGRAHLNPHVTGKYRAGDIRHCFADIGKARAELGFAPKVEFEAGLQELAEWLAGRVADDSVEAATRELEDRGLVA